MWNMMACISSYQRHFSPTPSYESELKINTSARPCSFNHRCCRSSHFTNFQSSGHTTRQQAGPSSVLDRWSDGATSDVLSYQGSCQRQSLAKKCCLSLVVRAGMTCHVNEIQIFSSQRPAPPMPDLGDKIHFEFVCTSLTTRGYIFT